MPRIYLLLTAACLCLATPVPAGGQATAPLPAITTEGTHLVNSDGEPVILQGCNVGNWLLLEMWMLAIDHGQFEDQYSFEANLAARFGNTEKDRLMEVYRENWVTPRDFEIIRSFGFNVIRLPFNYRLLEDDARPGQLKPHAFRWLDRAIEMAEQAGLYVILDMHAVPGGQSVDHPTGRVGQNHLWDDPANGTRTAWLWKQIAERYRGRTSVAGYDVINEPYGDFSTDVRPRLREIFVEIYDAIREVDEQHVIFAPSGLWGGHDFYGNPHENGWTNVAFTEHHYPGLFGSDPSRQTHGDFIYRGLPEKQAYLETVRTPMFIGEWNPVFENLGGGDLMRRYFDEYGGRGWAATIWSYKILHPEGGNITDNWYMVSNARPLDRLDFAAASAEKIEAWFKAFATMEYVIDEPMRHALTRPDPVPLDLPLPPPPVTVAPHHDAIAGWTATDIGTPLAGGQRADGDDAMTIYGGGRDIWGTADEFRFVSREVTGDFVFTATVDQFKRTHFYAKAGLMVRADLSEGSAQDLLNVFPDGNVVAARRDAPGDAMLQIDAEALPWPIHLRIIRRGNVFRHAYSADGQTWTPVGGPVVADAIGPTCHVGLAVLSHDAETLTEASFSGIRLERP